MIENSNKDFNIFPPQWTDIGSSLAALLNRWLKTITRIQTTRTERTEIWSYEGQTMSTNLLPEVCKQPKNHTHAVSTVRHLTGLITSNNIAAQLRCLRHCTSACARRRSLIGQNAAVRAYGERVSPRGSARTHPHTACVVFTLEREYI